MNKRNFFSGLVVLAFFLFFYAYTLRLDETAAYWPKLVCIAGIVLSAVNTVLAGIKMKKAADETAVFPLSVEQLKRSAVLLVVAGVWIFMVPHIGYLVTSLLATGLIVVFFEPVKTQKRVVRDVVITLIFSVIIYQLFALLGVHFPKGLLL